MIIWQGGFKGLLPLVTIVAVIVTTALLKLDFNTPVPLTFVVCIYSVLLWFLGNKLNQRQHIQLTDEEGNAFVNEKTGEPLISESHNDYKMYWIPIQYWALIIPVLSYFFFKDL